MQVSVESLSNLERRMTVQVPAERIQEEVDRRLKSLVKRVRIDGFRPGKVPLKVVQKRYGEGVYQEVLGEILQSSYQEALAQERIIPAGTPDIEPQSMEAGQPLEYVATFEVFPEVQPADMSGAQIKRPQVEITEADVDKVIESLRKQRREWVDVERPAAEGDQVVVDFKGTLDGEAFEGGEAEDVPIELGQGRMIKDFEDQLPGVNPGEEKTIEVNFPEDYPAEHLAGRTAEFALTVKKVQEPSLPELNDEFAKAFGVEEGGMEKLREEVKNNMSREMGQAVKARVKDQVMDALLERNSVDLPSAIVQEEINRLREQTQSRYGMNQEGAPQLPDEQFKADAERRVGLGLVIREIVRQHDIKVDQDKVTAELEAMAAGYEDPQQVISYYRGNKQAMSGLEAMVLEQQVVEWVLAQCEVSDEPMSFDALMNPSQENQA
ncbi:trigger factor [Ectothiorhodospira haloalkaliphila]|uniref:Trigger factor n=1 Tax=Ectothiorhodospira haloalkaliphila TaxID=421628 RepID=W8KFH1_9GAMM|nr:trigger factor [Ectothiorhodospira haloalkaliphila]AHK78534.1 trigger factor [Ectothiorhodospira haloalkaliphila]